MSAGVIGIFGAPNSGKTTFMAVIYGLLSRLYSHRIVPSDSASSILLRGGFKIDFAGSDANLEKYLRDKVERILSGISPRRTEPSLFSAMNMRIICGRKRFLLRIADTSGENYVVAAERISSYLDMIKSREPGLIEHILMGAPTRSMSWSTILRTIRDIFEGINEELYATLLRSFADELSGAFYRAYILILDRKGDIDLQDRMMSSLMLYVLLKHIRYNRGIKTPMIIREARFIVDLPVIIAFSKSEAERMNWYDKNDSWLNAAALLEFKRLFPRTYDVLTRFFSLWRKLRRVEDIDTATKLKKLSPTFYYSAFGRAVDEKPILEDGVLRPWRILLPLAYSLGVKW